MSYKAITIYTPADAEPHITAEDDAFIYDSLFACSSGRLGGLECQRVDDNTVRLLRGGAANQGYILRVAAGGAHDMTITNCAQSLSRHDIVVARFTRGGNGIADTHEFAVVEGVPSTDPVDPELTVSELHTQGDVNEVALYRVVVAGTAIAYVEPIGEDLGTTGMSLSSQHLAVPRTIALSGDAEGQIPFDGSADVSLSATVTGLNGCRVTISADEPDYPEEGDLWISYGEQS